MDLTWNEVLPLIFMAVMGLALLAYVMVLKYMAGKPEFGETAPPGAQAAGLPGATLDGGPLTQGGRL